MSIRPGEILIFFSICDNEKRVHIYCCFKFLLLLLLLLLSILLYCAMHYDLNNNYNFQVQSADGITIQLIE